MENKNVTCVVRKKVVVYYTAITPDGLEIPIRGLDDMSGLVDGQELIGDEINTEEQDKYSDGSYARSYHIEHYLKVSKVGIRDHKINTIL